MIFQQSGQFQGLINYYEIKSCKENSVDPDQLTSEEASWSGSTMFSIENIYLVSYWFYKSF